MRRLCSLSVPRSSAFARLTPKHIDFFRTVLGSRLLTKSHDTSGFTKDWLGKYQASNDSCVVLQPTSVEEIQCILRYCNAEKIAVVPQGGNTGLVGGSVPVYDEVVLSMSKMDSVVTFDPVSGVLVAEAGCVLESLETFLSEHGFMMPLDLGAKGSCQIGGNVSTNAGGVRVVKYGSLHGSVLGIEAVLANGDLYDGLCTLRKDNTGYALNHLFIGAEGTLGVVTKVSLTTPRRPTLRDVAFLGLTSFGQVLSVVEAARKQLPDILSAIEFIDRGSMDLVLSHSTGVDPLSQPFPFYMLLETSSFTGSSTDSERLNEFLMELLENEIVSDGTIAQDATQSQCLWNLRESVTESLTRAGTVFKYDVSVPVERMYDMVELMRKRLESTCGLPYDNVVGYGHVGDQNLHLNIWVPRTMNSIQVLDSIEPFVYEQVKEWNGSISAEHGLGIMKAQHIGYSKSQTLVAIMKRVKQIYDPVGIMNPYKVLP